MRRLTLELAQGWRKKLCANNRGRLREKVGAFALRRHLSQLAHPWRSRRKSYPPPAEEQETLMAKQLTWKEVVTAEPRLANLYADVCAVRDVGGNSFCANAAWYGYRGYGFKERMFNLVGFYAANPDLRTMEAYDLAYDKLYRALPNCRNCACM